MDLEELKKEAAEFESKDIKALETKLITLKSEGMSFLGCVAFIQHHKHITLKEARELTLRLDIYTPKEKHTIHEMDTLMRSEFEEE